MVPDTLNFLIAGRVRSVTELVLRLRNGRNYSMEGSNTSVLLPRSFVVQLRTTTRDWFTVFQGSAERPPRNVSAIWHRFPVSKIGKSALEATALYGCTNDREFSCGQPVFGRVQHDIPNLELSDLQLRGVAHYAETCGWTRPVDSTVSSNFTLGKCASVVPLWYKHTKGLNWSLEDLEKGFCCEDSRRPIHHPDYRLRYKSCADQPGSPSAGIAETLLKLSKQGRRKVTFMGDSLAQQFFLAVASEFELLEFDFGDEADESMDAYLGSIMTIKEGGNTLLNAALEFHRPKNLVTCCTLFHGRLRNFFYKQILGKRVPTDFVRLRYQMAFWVLDKMDLDKTLAEESLLVVDIGHWYDHPFVENRSYVRDMQLLYCDLASFVCESGGMAVVHNYEAMHFPPGWMENIVERHPEKNFIDRRNCTRDRAEQRSNRYWPQVDMAHKFRNFFAFIDTSDAMALRNDAHPERSKKTPLDCMHWCFGPGVMDPWLVELQQAIETWHAPSKRQCQDLSDMCPSIQGSA